jgi:hypothetical protein
MHDEEMFFGDVKSEPRGTKRYCVSLQTNAPSFGSPICATQSPELVL